MDEKKAKKLDNVTRYFSIALWLATAIFLYRLFGWTGIAGLAVVFCFMLVYYAQQMKKELE